MLSRLIGRMRNTLKVALRPGGNNELDQICPLCGGHKKQGATTFTVDMGNPLVVVRDVPATICSLCGNAWLSDEVAGDIEIIIEEPKKNHRQMEVTQYRKAA